MKNFKLKGVGIDTTNLNYELSTELWFDYVHTSISSNNENLVSDWTELYESAPLITSIDFLDHRTVLIDHLRELHRTTIDLLLVNASCDFSKYVEMMQEEIDDEIVGEIGIRNPESVEQLENIKQYVNFNKVALDICPYNFNCEIIKWCENNGIMVVGFNPFGGHIDSSNIINTFGVQYLLGFASRYTDLLFLSGNDVFESHDLAELLNEDYIISLEDNTSEQKTPKKDEFTITKTVNKLSKKAKRLINTSIKLDKDTIVPCNLSELLFGFDELISSFGESTLQLPTQEPNELQQCIEKFLSCCHFPEDSTDRITTLTVARLRILIYLSILGKTCEYTRIGEEAFVLKMADLTLKKRILGGYKAKLDNEESYLLCLNSSGEVVFQKLNNVGENV